MRKNARVRVSAKHYDAYTDKFVNQYDDIMIMRLMEEYRNTYQGGPGILIDVGTGTGRLLIKLAEITKLSLIGIDYFEDMVTQAKETVKEAGFEDRIQIAQGDVHSMAYPDNYADFIISRSTVHHWENPVLAFKEIYRVLKPGGLAILHDIRKNASKQALEEFNKKREEIGIPPSNLDEKYTVEDIEAFLKEAGLFDCSRIVAPEYGALGLGYELKIRK